MQRGAFGYVHVNVKLWSLLRKQLFNTVGFCNVFTDFYVPTKIRLEPVDVNIYLVHFL